MCDEIYQLIDNTEKCDDHPGNQISCFFLICYKSLNVASWNFFYRGCYMTNIKTMIPTFCAPYTKTKTTQRQTIQRHRQQDQVHLASRTHFVDLVIQHICSQKIIPYFADLIIHNICSQKIMPYFF